MLHKHPWLDVIGFHVIHLSIGDWSFMSSGLHNGRVAIVTGAGSGIGKSTTERFISEGGSVVAVDKDDDFFEWAESHGNIFPIAVDITQS